jgi:hypothetical protein
MARGVSTFWNRWARLIANSVVKEIKKRSYREMKALKQAVAA